ncbi:MAG: diguanylate cyclase [Campylobacterales bacterium]|nr:diguanylate cyclase [Campylobacterales bacterium]
MIRYIVAFIVSALIGTALIALYFHSACAQKIDAIGERLLLKTHAFYDAVISTHKIAAQKDYNHLISNPEAMCLLQSFKYADKEDQALIRGELFRLMYRQYDEMKVLHVRQFHLHTHKGESLLRFHIPYESGDCLMELRTSIRKANTELISVSGFEGGRIFPGYRYIFPIIKEGDHLGSVEFSVAFEAIEAELKSFMPQSDFQLIMTKESSFDAVFTRHQRLLSPSLWSEAYYVEASDLSRVNREIKSNSTISRLTALAKATPGFEKRLQRHERFAVPIVMDEEGYMVLFEAINNTDNEHAGYMVGFTQEPMIRAVKREYQSYFFATATALLLMLLMASMILRQYRRSQRDQKSLEALNVSLHQANERLERFINLQRSIVILTDGKRFSFANRSFYDFFGYENLQAFLEQHACICELFVEHESFFSLSKVKEGEAHWIESLLNLPARQRIVSMHDAQGHPHAFAVDISHYDETIYLVDFADISETMVEKLQLESLATRDQLTGAFNRTFFYASIETIHNLHQQNGLLTCILFFDIDHFKAVNDTHGHLVGDNVLQVLAALLSAKNRKNDYLIRWGGEEFLIVSGTVSMQSGIQKAEHLRALVDAHSFEIIGHLTCSFGVACGDAYHTTETLIQRADEKLYEAKAAGRNRVCA